MVSRESTARLFSTLRHLASRFDLVSFNDLLSERGYLVLRLTMRNGEYVEELFYSLLLEGGKRVRAFQPHSQLRID